MTLCTQSDVELFGQVDFTSEPDTAVTLWIAAATRAVESFCDRPLLREAGKIETFTPLNWPTLRLDLFPIDVITTITEDGTALASDEYTADAASGVIQRHSSSGVPRGWPYTGKLNTTIVTYTAGYEEADPTNDVPDDLRMAAAIAVGDIFRAGAKWAASQGAERVTIEGRGTIDFGSEGSEIGSPSQILSPAVRSLLAPYRRYTPSSGGRIAG